MFDILDIFVKPSINMNFDLPILYKSVFQKVKKNGPTTD